MAAPNRFVQALWDNDVKLAETLVADFADISREYEPMGWTAPHLAVENNCIESAKWLLQKGADPNQQDASGWTPLFRAIDMEGDSGGQEWVKSGKFPYPADMTELLLKHGANPNVKDKSGESPLRLARHYGHSLVVELLIQYGATKS